MPRIENPFNGPWDFLSNAVWTRDEASGRVRQFPAACLHEGEERFAYLEYLTQERLKYKVAAYEKSRRMMITWWLVALYLYDIMSESNHLDAVMSDKLLKSAYLIGPDRMQFIYDRIPPVSEEMLIILRSQQMDLGPFRENVWKNKPVVNFVGKQGEGWEWVVCERTGSKCMAIASGSAQTQQYTFSNVLMDEFPRWQWQESSWRNIQPTTQGGGHVDIVCTPEMGAYAEDLIYDTGRA